MIVALLEGVRSSVLAMNVAKRSTRLMGRGCILISYLDFM